MKQLVIMLLLFFSFNAWSGFFSQIQLEDTLQNRLQDTFKIYDPTAKILVRLDLKRFEGNLPGTAEIDGAELIPSLIELTDISKIRIEVYTNLKDIPEEAKSVLIENIPIQNKKIIDINYNKIDPKKFSIPRGFEANDLINVANKTTSTLSKVLFSILFILLLVGISAMAYFGNKRMKELKTQFNILASAISESGGGGRPLLQDNASNRGFNDQLGGFKNIPEGTTLLEKYKNITLEALFSDAYWCSEDGYASWLWKNTTNEQKNLLLDKLSFLKEYSLSFSDKEPRNYKYHEHPYYMDPLQIQNLSQDDLMIQVKKDLGLWHSISPMRRQNLKLSIQEKLKAFETENSSGSSLSSLKPSKYRSLEIKPTFGSLSAEDEFAIFKNPSFVPDKIKPYIKSLVWLAEKDEKTIRDALSQINTKSLASAWIGPEELLKKLEYYLPEKKLKLLLSYTKKITPSKNSEAYNFLFEIGVTHTPTSISTLDTHKDEAA